MNRTDTLVAADDCITNSRAATHGSAHVGFAAIARMWAALEVARGGREIGAVDVALCQAAVKLVRASANPEHADNWVDLAGYAALGCEIATGCDEIEIVERGVS